MADFPCGWCNRGRFRQSPWLFTFVCDECGVATVDEQAPRRICCVVPFCRRTRGDRKNHALTPGMEWICSHHWRLVPRSLKARRSKLRRMETKTGDAARLHRIDKADRVLWERCKREAIERAAGI